MPKQFAFGPEAREPLRAGLNQLCDAVRVTLGPRGRNVVLDKEWGPPMVTNDGVTIAKEITLSEPFQNIGAELGKEVSSKTQEDAGDGTTTAVVLAQAMVAEGLRAVAGGVHPMAVKRGLDRGAGLVVQEIARGAKKVRGRVDIAAVATLAANQDPELGELIAEALEKVGEDGVVTVEEGKGRATTLDVVEGMRLDRGYLSPYFVTDPERMEVNLRDPYLLLCAERIGTLNDILPLLEAVAKKGRGLLLMAEDVEGDALAALVVNRLRGTLETVAVKSPGFGDRRREVLEDIAVVTGGTVISADTGRTLESATLRDLGQVDRAVVDKDSTTLVGGRGRKSTLAARAGQIRSQMEETAGDYDQQKLAERLARLAGGVAVIRVGASTDLEMKETKARAEDALAATRAAVEEGIVPGGGLALFRASSVLEGLALPEGEQVGVDILRRALYAPLAQIAENAGFPGAVMVERVRDAKPEGTGFNAITLELENLAEAGVLDPAKVVRTALQNAVSIAGLILTTETLVVEVPEDPDEEPEPEAEE
jgi:chaperonin GroEL